ncbi:hypothetical protein TNCV_2169171 [Trichonephila clavipes]|nr:hypothetical protein TNCV_2169171 [Trichonephila clavipes]
MDFTEMNSGGSGEESLGRIVRQNSRFRTAKTIIIKFGLHASFVELESAKNAVNESALSKNLKVGHQKKGVYVHPKYKRDGKITCKSDSDSTMCAKNSDILLAENSLMDTEISISDEGSHAGERNNI